MGGNESDSLPDSMGFTRPVPALATYFLLSSLMYLPIFPIVWLFRMFKYWTLEYAFDTEGISMKWGVMWRREIHLTYRRIQDIHLTRNVLQRWMRLANVSVQTAGGSSGPEMVIEGAPEPEALRDALYARMRGSHDVDSASIRSEDGVAAQDGDADRVIDLLVEIRDLLKARD